MKSLKFRVWDKLNAIMCEVISIDFKYQEIWCGEPATGDIHFNDSELMQFTGLFDKNGKEIYEGDILNVMTDGLLLVIWNQHYASYCLRREGWAYSHWFHESCEPEDCEVIGNIFENEDLLK